MRQVCGRAHANFTLISLEPNLHGRCCYCFRGDKIGDRKNYSDLVLWHRQKIIGLGFNCGSVWLHPLQDYYYVFFYLESLSLAHKHTHAICVQCLNFSSSVKYEIIFKWRIFQYSNENQSGKENYMMWIILRAYKSAVKSFETPECLGPLSCRIIINRP